MKRVFSFALALFLILILLATLIVGLFGGPDRAPCSALLSLWTSPSRL